MHYIILVVDETTKALLGKRIDKLDDQVVVVVAKDPEEIMSTVQEHVALSKVIDKLVDHGIVLHEKGYFELSFEFVRVVSERGKKRGNPVLLTLREWNTTMGMNKEELARATMFIEGFLEE